VAGARTGPMALCGRCAAPPSPLSPLRVCLGPPTNATIVVPLSEEALIDDAVAIVLGHVTAIQGNYDHTRGMIFTNVTVAIEDVLKGEIPVGEISLRQLGGSVGDLHSWVVGSPEFTLGEKALLFLRTDRDGNLRVAHLYQGKFTVSRDLAPARNSRPRKRRRECMHDAASRLGPLSIPARRKRIAFAISRTGSGTT